MFSAWHYLWIYFRNCTGYGKFDQVGICVNVKMNTNQRLRFVICICAYAETKTERLSVLYSVNAAGVILE